MSQKVKEGADAEKNFVKAMNRNKNDLRWKILGFDDATNYYVVRVTTQKDSKIHNKKVPCKSDVFVAKSEKTIEKFNLNEDDLEKYELTPVDGTGISIKKEDAKKIQWQKLGINAVREVFGNTEIGAGISLYERKGANHNSLHQSLEANRIIVEKWCGSVKSFEKFYENISGITDLLDNKVDDERRKAIAKKLGVNADTRMKDMINKDDELKKKIFWGKEVFEEPFCASWVFENSNLKITDNYYPKYSITTGNSRTKTFTIAIKDSK